MVRPAWLMLRRCSVYLPVGIHTTFVDISDVKISRSGLRLFQNLLSTRLDILHSKLKPGRKGGTILIARFSVMRIRVMQVAKLIGGQRDRMGPWVLYESSIERVINGLAIDGSFCFYVIA